MKHLGGVRSDGGEGEGSGTDHMFGSGCGGCWVGMDVVVLGWDGGFVDVGLLMGV